MDTTTITALIVALIVVVGVIAGAVILSSRRRTQRLQQRFGPEYARAVDDAGGAREAEALLARREKRVERLHLKDLTAGERDQFSNEWQAVQASFIDSPRDAALHADELLGLVMTARGYPAGQFEDRLEDLSVEHASAVQNYRAAHTTLERHTDGEGDTEDLRRAIIDYRALFEDLIGQPPRERAAA